MKQINKAKQHSTPKAVTFPRAASGGTHVHCTVASATTAMVCMYVCIHVHCTCWVLYRARGRLEFLLCKTLTGSSFFFGKVTALGVLCFFALFVCLILLASFFLPSHLSLKHVCTVYMYMYIHVCKHVNWWTLAVCTIKLVCVYMYTT